MDAKITDHRKPQSPRRMHLPFPAVVLLVVALFVAVKVAVGS